MRCFNCEQYTPMGYIYCLSLPKKTYHICSKCISKALGEDTMGCVDQPRKIRERNNLLFYDKVIKRISEYEPVIF